MSWSSVGIEHDGGLIEELDGRGERNWHRQDLPNQEAPHFTCPEAVSTWHTGYESLCPFS
jgi:hypothetical protein